MGEDAWSKLRKFDAFGKVRYRGSQECPCLRVLSPWIQTPHQ